MPLFRRSLSREKVVGFLSRKSIAGFAIELVVVFLGVYLAFLFSDYQEELRDRAIRVKYYDSLITELSQFRGHLEEENRTIQMHMAVIAEIEQGLRPDLPVRHLSYLYRGDVAAAAFDSENFDALDVEVLQHILGSVLGLQFLEKRVDLFNELTTTALLPMRASGSPEYDADGKLLAHLAWYPRLVSEIEWANRSAVKGVVEQAIPDLEEARDELLARRLHWPF